MPRAVMLTFERFMQVPLAKTYFGLQHVLLGSQEINSYGAADNCQWS